MDQDHLDLMTRCAQVCERMIMHCLNMGAEHAEPEHIRILMDCAGICGLNAQYLLRDSEFSGSMMRLCAEVCDRCADSCERIGGMEECITACQACARACREAEGQ